MQLRAVVGVALLLASCSAGDAGSDAGPVSASVTTTASSVSTDDVFAPGDSSVDEMRPVPTVPDSTVLDSPPTLVAPPPEPVDPDAPATSRVPPSTDLVGDPQPTPSTAPATTPAPTTLAPGQDAPDACARLDGFGVSEAIAARSGAGADGVVASNGVCRFASGPIVVEVAFVPIAAVRSDWYLRDGVQPVGEVGGDAVGLATFVTPDGRSGTGYTVATIGGSDGVIISTMGIDDARRVAGDVAVAAQQAA